MSLSNFFRPVYKNPFSDEEKRESQDLSWMNNDSNTLYTPFIIDKLKGDKTTEDFMTRLKGIIK